MHILISPALIRQVAVGSVCVAILLAVLCLYLQPEFMLTLADQVWGCF